jgi:ribonuclease J
VGPEFFAVNHSIPDALAVAIRSGAGTVLHTGDFKMDQTPLDGRVTDLPGFSRLGAEGVDLLLADSTNAEVPGFIPSERDVGRVIADVIGKAGGRVIVACFASHVHRVQQVLDAAKASGRHVAWWPLNGAQHADRPRARAAARSGRAHGRTGRS